MIISVPEIAFADSIKLTFVADNGASHSSISDPFGTREIIFDSAVEQAGNHTIFFTNFSSLVEAVDSVQSLSNMNDLVDGMPYDIRLNYQDRAGNDVVFSTNSRVYFSGSATLPPIMAAPIGFIPALFDVDFVIKENALSGTLKLIIKCVSTSDEVADFVTPDRVIVFADTNCYICSTYRW